LVAWFIQNQESALTDARHDKTKSLIDNIEGAAKERGTLTNTGRAVTIRNLRRCGIPEEAAKTLAQDHPEKYAIEKTQPNGGGRPSPCFVLLKT
jgi:hypothetical protein